MYYLACELPLLNIMMQKYIDEQRIDLTPSLKGISSVSEKRDCRRNIVSLKAIFVFEGVNYVGLIENISECGLYMISLPSKSTVSFNKGAMHDLKLRNQCGELMKVQCMVQWSYKTPPYGLTVSVGMEILDRSPQFVQFLSTL